MDLTQQIATNELDFANIEEPARLFSLSNVTAASLITDNFIERNDVLEKLTPDIEQWSSFSFDLSY